MDAKGRDSEAEQAERPAETGFRALIRIHGLLDRVMQPYFGRFGLSRSQWGVLRTLHRAELDRFAGLRLVDLCDTLLVRPPSVTGLIDRLQRLGYVVRLTSTRDLRGKEVRLTLSGRSLVERILKCHGSQIRSVMAGLDTTQLVQFRFLLERLATHLESMLEEADHAEV